MYCIKSACLPLQSHSPEDNFISHNSYFRDVAGHVKEEEVALLSRPCLSASCSKCDKRVVGLNDQMLTAPEMKGNNLALI